MAYIPTSLHQTIHAGLSVELVPIYIKDIIGQGYQMIHHTTFDITAKHLLVISSNKSVVIPHHFAFFNVNTPKFTIAEDIFNKCNLLLLGKSFLSNIDALLLRASPGKSLQGQPSMINFGYKMQNCTDKDALPGLNIPKLTTKTVEQLENTDTKEKLIYHIVEMMTS
eukprot:5013203-Ditylum_brightwellii.AAC.1